MQLYVQPLRLYSVERKQMANWASLVNSLPAYSPQVSQYVSQVARMLPNLRMMFLCAIL